MDRDPRAGGEIYKLWRPSPLYRAHRLGAALGTRARIYYKYEGASPVGSHKTNSSVAQAFYNHEAGVKRLTTETGAGRWGAALAFACQVFGMECDIWQVRNSYETKPYRRIQMETFGARVTPSPSDRTETGRALRERFPDTTGSLGMAISEAIEAAATDPEANYSLGSVLNHVALHQTVIGLEALAQLASAEERLPDHLFACAGGGSNLAGLSFPFLHENLTAGGQVRIVACEPAAAPSLTQGEYRYDFGDTANPTPLLKMYTLGADFVPDPVHAGGLRFHGMAPLVSAAYDRSCWTQWPSASGTRSQPVCSSRERRASFPRRVEPRDRRRPGPPAGSRGRRRRPGHPDRRVRQRPAGPAGLRGVPVRRHAGRLSR